MAVKNLVFDFGNVLIDLDIPRTEKALRLILGEVNLQHLPPQFWNDYETGRISESAFLDSLQQLKPSANRNDLIVAWNAMLLHIPPIRFEMLLVLKKTYNVFLLSNTNATHIHWIYNYLLNTYSITNWDTHYFHKTYFSHLIGLRKPDIAIYDFVIEDAQLNPAETLLIDDNAANIQAAQQAGWQTALHPIGAEICAVLDGYISIANWS